MQTLGLVTVFCLFAGGALGQFDPCSTTPCLNGAVCVSSSSTTYTCQCRDGYYGPLCGEGGNTVKPGQCPSITGAGICVEGCSDDSSCPNQQKCCSNGCGHVCLIPVLDPVDVCLSAPCQNGGSCASINGNYVCNCTSGFTGVNCENRPGQCPQISGVGICTEACSDDSSCPDQLKCCSNGCGHVCAIPLLDSCNPNPCHNDGLCVPSGLSSYLCICVNGFTGSNCDTGSDKPGQCPPVSGAGICVQACTDDSSCPNQQKCCSNGCGRTCTNPVTVPVDVCLSAPCQNGGRCTSYNGNYICNCTSGFTGVNCENRPGQCPQISGVGICSEACSDDSSCPDQLKCCSNGCGHVCAIPLPDSCNPNPCHNDGLCVPSGLSSYLCICVNGFTGPNCNTGSEKPGQCPPVSGAGICVQACSGDSSCPNQQKCCSNGCGRTCTNPVTVSIDVCLSAPCQNGGFCTSYNGNYICNCTSGFTGVNCENRPGQCPQISGVGICTEACSDDSSCPDQLKCCSNGCGHVCAIPLLDSCNPNPCHNDGLCVPSGLSSYLCICVNGFTGPNCDTGSDKPGQCPPVTGLGICSEACSGDSSCPDQLKCCSNGCGHSCYNPVTVVDVCQSAPCQNGGTCSSSNYGYTCGCTPGYTGVNCETRLSTDRPGQCPLISGVGLCYEACSSDSSCPDQQKCCSNGCGHVCAIPVIEKPGQCPPVTGAGICVQACSDDSSCPNQQKCCSNGCGHTCNNPVTVVDVCQSAPCQNGGTCSSSSHGYTCGCTPGYTGVNCETRLSTDKPGQCPQISGAGLCYEACSSDSSCPDQQKCCSNGCGHVCAIPVIDPIDVCLSVPCQNGGLCTSINGGYTCHCTSGFTGVNCENKPGQCPPVTGLGICSEACSGDSSCPNQQKCCSNGCGHACTNPVTVVDVCQSAPCQNGGTCSSSSHGYTCGCTPGYTGVNCETRLTTEKPGQCPPVTGAGICVQACSDDSSCPNQQKCCSNGCGHTCNNPVTVVDVCQSAPCQNGGTCSSSSHGYTCGCIPGYTGVNCETRLSTDKPGQCPQISGAGLCYEACSSDSSCPDQQKCCSNGCGHVCAIPVIDPIDVCLSVPCQNGGLCTSINGGYTCHCTSGFTGVNCENKPGQCPPVTGLGICSEACSGDSSCPNQQKCCSNGCGHACTNPVTVVDVCQSAPCQNGGTCSSSSHGYTCGCTPGYTGVNCETRLTTEKPGQCPPVSGAGLCYEACSSDSSCPDQQKCCSNGCGHTCTNPVTVFDFCLSAPCQNGGTCSSSNYGYTCGCTPGYTGVNCETRLTTDKPGQCPPVSGAGICVQACSDDSSCPDQQKCCSNGCGHTCTNPVTVVDVCRSAPCQNGGICSSSNYGYTCGCTPGYTGVNCETRLSTEKPGQCPPVSGVGICSEACSGDSSCPDQQKCCSNGCGHVCANPVTVVDVCQSAPCQNGGTCSSSNYGYTCGCTPGYTGVNCETWLSNDKPGQCPPVTGLGICVEGCSDDSSCPNQQKCCSNGCGHACTNPVTVVDVCQSAPCQNGGTCSSSNYGYTCGCTPGYTGVNCETWLTTEKPGQCPTVSGLGICSEACSDDSSCPNQQKCCSNGCGHTCTNPVPVDHNPPTFSQCPTNIARSAPAGLGGVRVTWPELRVEDDSGEEIHPIQTEGAQSGSVFQPGSHIITYTASDQAGNTAHCTFIVVVTVMRDVPPTIVCPSDIHRKLSRGESSAVITWEMPTILSSSGPARMTYQSMESGISLRLGKHTIYYRYSDDSNMEAACSFTVTITGSTKPGIEEPKPPSGHDGKGLILPIATTVVAVVFVLAVVMSIGYFMFIKRRSMTKAETSSVGSDKRILKNQNSTEESRYASEPMGKTHEIA